MEVKKNRYPRLHVAESTVNRILNVAAQVPQPVSVTVPPAMPDVALQGAELDAKMKAPPAPAAMPAEADGAVQSAALSGADPVQAAVDSLLLPGRT